MRKASWSRARRRIGTGMKARFCATFFGTQSRWRRWWEFWFSSRRMCGPLLRWSLSKAQWARRAEGRVAEGFDCVADRVRQSHGQAVVRFFFELERTAHLETETAADHHERNVIQRV